jgi:hypothetical protein
MGNDAFDGQVLTEKLRKLNNSQQSIECILNSPLLICLGCFMTIFILLSLLYQASVYIYYGIETFHGAIDYVHSNM